MSNKIFRFKADERFNKWVGVPGSSGKRNITEYYISLKANSMVPEIPKDPNPRVQAPHKGIYKQIGIDLRNGNSPFWYYMNHGLQIIAKKIEYDSATRMVTMTMHPGDGIADGCPEKYLTHDNLFVYQHWIKYRKWGLPDGPAWGKQSAVMLDVFQTLDIEYQKFDERKRAADGS